MTVKEAQQVFDELKAQGNTEEDIVGMLYQMFIDDNIDINEFGALADLLGYELTDEFKAMSPEDQKTKGWEADGEGEAPESMTEDGKEVQEGEGKEPPKAEAGGTQDKAEDDKKADDKEEEDDDAKAAKLFGFGKKD